MFPGPLFTHGLRMRYTWVVFRETLKASGDEVHAALRDAELRVGQALSKGDAAKRDAEAARAEVPTVLRACVDVWGCFISLHRPR